MSTSEAGSRLTIQGGATTLEIEVIDSNFAPVARSIGTLDVQLEPGLYEIDFREGSANETRLLKVHAGTNVVEPPRFEPASPAPVDKTSTSHEYHQQRVLEATDTIARECAGSGPETGGIIVMVRNVRGQDALAFPLDLPRRLSLVGASLDPLDTTGGCWEESGRDGWALWRKAVVPGGYAIRIAGDDQDSEVLFQSLWVDEGWQTMVFIPNTAGGPATDLATVHIARVGVWTPWSEGSEIAIALESVLAGLRAGRSVVPEDLEQLLYANSVNPFLGIAAAHALLMTPEPSHQLLTTVVENLERLLPLSPDVIALGHRARRAGVDVYPLHGVAWPPMLYLGYRALLRADASSPGIILDDSPAARVAAVARVVDLWTTWAESAPDPEEGIRGLEMDMLTHEEAIDPAAERVLAYVESAAKVEGVSEADILGERSIRQLALATALPSTAVQRAVSKLRTELA